MVNERYVTVLTLEQIADRIQKCDQNIAIFSDQVKKQEELKSELLRMKIIAESR